MGNDERLIEAAMNGDLKAVKQALDRGANVDAMDGWALRAAVNNAETDKVSLLLDRGANIHAMNDRALQVAAEWGNTEMVKLLLDRGADVHAMDESVVRAAEHNGDRAIATLLKDRAAGKRPTQSTEATKEPGLPERTSNLQDRIEQAKNKPTANDDDRGRGSARGGR